MSPESGPASWERSPEELTAELASRFLGRLRVFAARRVDTPDEGEDIAQETLRRTLEALRSGRVRDPDALPAFVFETARNICLHHGRSAGREARALSRFGREQREGTPLEEDPLHVLISEERQAEVRRALARLSEADRLMLLLTYCESLDAAEIARRLGIEPGAVRVRRHRALRRLALHVRRVEV